jgi:hypothetical protein
MFLETLFDSGGFFAEVLGIKLKDGIDAATKFAQTKGYTFLRKYLTRLIFWFSMTIIPSVMLTSLGILIDSAWPILFAIILRVICTLIFMAYAVIAAIVIRALTGKLEGSGEWYEKLVLGVCMTEAFFGLLICIIPLKNNTSLIPAFLLASLILGSFNAIFFKPNVMIAVVGIIFAVLVLSFFLPALPGALSGKVGELNSALKGSPKTNTSSAVIPPAPKIQAQPVAPQQVESDDQNGDSLVKAESQNPIPPAPAAVQPPAPVQPAIPFVKAFSFCPNQYNGSGWQKVCDFPEAGYYDIDASGTCGIGSSKYNGGPVTFRWLGPEGMQAKPVYQNELPFFDKNVCSLIGKTDVNGEFHIGKSKRIYVSAPTSLWLNFNHLQSQAGYGDPANVFRYNKGNWNIEVKEVS